MKKQAYDKLRLWDTCAPKIDLSVKVNLEKEKIQIKVIIEQKLSVTNMPITYSSRKSTEQKHLTGHENRKS